MRGQVFLGKARAMKPRYMKDVAPFSKDGRELLSWTLYARPNAANVARHHTQLGSYLGTEGRKME